MGVNVRGSSSMGRSSPATGRSSHHCSLCLSPSLSGLGSLSSTTTNDTTNKARGSWSVLPLPPDGARQAPNSQRGTEHHRLASGLTLLRRGKEQCKCIRTNRQTAVHAQVEFTHCYPQGRLTLSLPRLAYRSSCLLRLPSPCSRFVSPPSIESYCVAF